MTQEQINEGNKLIAEFMGYKPCQFNYGRYECPFLELENDIIDGEKNGAYFIEGRLRFDYYPYEMKFNTSWNWLIPVLEKCLTTNHEGDLHMKLNDALLTLNIIEIWNVVIEFIKWYNENKTTT